MSKDPAFLFYPGDASNDTQFMNRLERGAYFDLLKAQRLFGGYTAVQVRKILGNDYESVWPALELVLAFDGEKYFIEWLRESLCAREAYAKKQSDRVKKRWNKHGNTAVLPKKENENENVIETENIIEKKKGSVRGKNKPESLLEVQAFFQAEGSDQAEAFFDYFESVDWVIGKSKKPCRNWRAAARNWIRSQGEYRPQKENLTTGLKSRPEAIFETTMAAADTLKQKLRENGYNDLGYGAIPEKS